MMRASEAKGVMVVRGWNRRWLVAAGLGGLIIAGVWINRSSQRAPEAMQTVEVKRMDLGASTDAGGILTAIRSVNLSPNVASRIHRLYVREGDRVKAGQLVAEMESDEVLAKLNQSRALLAGARAQKASAEAELKAAAARRSRHEQLLATGAISLDLMEELRNTERQANFRMQEAREKIEQARYEVKQNQALLRNTKVFAPFDGIITRLYAQIGQFVTPTTTASEQAGATSTSIAELSNGLEVVAKIPEESLSEVNPGQKAEVRTDAFPADVFRGVVVMVSPRAVSVKDVNAFPVTVKIETGLNRLKPAMNAQVRFLANPIRNALAIPLASLTGGDHDAKGVIRMQPDGALEFVKVNPGRVSGDYVQVLSGLKPGDKVLISAPPEGVAIAGYKP